MYTFGGAVDDCAGEVGDEEDDIIGQRGRAIIDLLVLGEFEEN